MSAPQSYYVPVDAGEAEFTEKRSRFLGHVRRVETEAEARAFLDEMRKKYYDARHNCWCYVLHEGGVVRYGDDGEPQGTAGIPMLEVLRRQNMTNCVCVVTRYFGGVLLGAGGLLRAYTKSAGDALAAAGTSVVRPWSCMAVPCSYSGAERLKTECTAMGGIIEDVEYSSSVTLKVLIPAETEADFTARIFDISGGTATPLRTGETHRAVRIK